MTIRAITIYKNDVLLCVDHKLDFQSYSAFSNKMRMAKSGRSHYHGSSLMMGFRYSIYYNGHYLMSVKNKYIPNSPLKPIEEFDISSWWFETAMFNSDFLKAEMNEKFNDRFGKFLVWCDIIPYYR